jgi:hypothetical protein
MVYGVEGLILVGKAESDESKGFHDYIHFIS